MRILQPRERYAKVIDIPIGALVARGIRGLILDVDNTMTTHGNPQPATGVPEWLDRVRQAGIRCVILSNNTPRRVEPFARLLSLEFEADAAKPLPGGFWRACSHMGVLPSEAASVGDQIFTDILGANLAGIHSIFVDPAQPEGGGFFRLKRLLEGPILTRFERSKTS
jgi:HAD superfamily phosphatase (TIGR01668 family)